MHPPAPSPHGPLDPFSATPILANDGGFIDDYFDEEKIF